MSPKTPQSWTRQSLTDPSKSYLLSTDNSLIDLVALSAAFESDLLYWAKPLSPSQLQLCVEQSLCFGIYVSSKPNHDINDSNNSKREMIGFARLITDYVTFGYLTDVYILPQHQGQGLAKWMMACLDDVLSSWPDLRRALLFTRDKGPAKMYGLTCGFKEIGVNGALIIMERPGTGTGTTLKGAPSTGDGKIEGGVTTDGE